nr:copper resistance protein B [Xanthomonas arboricola]
MSPPRTQYMALLALLLSASATAQEHQHAAMESSAHADGAHAMQIADQATAAQPQTSIATEASPPSAQQSAEAMQTEHAQMQHAQHSSTASAPASTKAADSTPAQRPVQADVSVAPASMHHAGMQHADVQHAAHQASANPQLDHTRQSQADSDHDATDHASMQHGQQHGAMDHSDMDHAPHAGAVTQTPASPPTGALPRTPIPEPTAEEIAAAFAPLQHHAMHAPGINHYVLLDRLEAFDTTRGSGQDWEARAWIGGDTDRLWLRSEGERQDGRTQAASVEALYGHAISPWWDLLVGARQDIGADEHRSWAAFGVQGLAPYKFETEATLYVGSGSGSRAALRLEGEYEVLLTNRLILQPRVEADIALTDDDRRGVGSGLEQVEAGLRLRYEITRRFAPYIGWVHSRSFGDTARRAAIDDEPARDSRFVAGVRIWF